MANFPANHCLWPNSTSGKMLKNTYEIRKSEVERVCYGAKELIRPFPFGLPHPVTRS